MKIKIFLALMLLVTVGRGVFATDITVSASTLSNAQFPSAGTTRSIVVNATNGSTTVTSAALFPPSLVGVSGWKIIIDGTTYAVSAVASTSSLTLSSSFTSSTTSYTATVPPVIFLQLYSDRAYTPLSATYVVQPGNPSQPNGFFARYGCSIISGSLYIPAVTIPSMIDSANAQDRTARLSAIFFTTAGARLVPYQSFTNFQVPATPTTTTWTALATYNAPASTYQLDSLTYSRDQVAALLASVAAISGVASNQLVYGASAITIASSSNATLNSSGNLVAATLASSAGITGQTLALSKTSTASSETMVGNTLTIGPTGAGVAYFGESMNVTTTTGLTALSGVVGSFAAFTNASAITVDEAEGVWGRVRNTVASAIITTGYGVFGEVLNSHASATVTDGRAGYFRVLNSGTMTNTYGVYVGDVTSGTQTNRAYSFYGADTNARNYFAGDTVIEGRTMTTDADAAIAGLYVPFSITKGDSNTRTFFGFRVKPTLNTPGNSNTTLNVISVDTTNTDATGVTTNLMNLGYGGVAQFVVTSGGALTINGAINGTTIPTSKTLVVTTDKLSVLAATSSAELAGVISDETGSGAAVFANSPAFTTPSLGVASAASLATSAASPLLLTNGQLVTIALTAQTSGATTLTIPDFAGVVDEFTFKTKTQTLSNKTFVAPVLGAATATSIAVGGGTAITAIYTGSASLDFGATAAGTCDTLTITVTGAADGDEVFLGIPTALATADTYQDFHGWVSGANTVSVKRCNPINVTTALSNPAAATVRATVIHH